jgi:hypothetical protein
MTRGRESAVDTGKKQKLILRAAFLRKLKQLMQRAFEPLLKT